jgi:Ribosomal protein L7/L12 C-terminal domain
MDTNSLLILGLALLIILIGLQRGGGQQGIRLARLERKVDALLKKFEVNPDAEVDADVLALVREGHRIEAIKRLRERTGVGLKEAKEYVDQL